MQIRSIIIIIFLSISSVFAQGNKKVEKSKKKHFRDFFTIKVPTIKYARPDTLVMKLSDQEKKSTQKVEYYFDPTRSEKSILEDIDTNNVDSEDFNIVEVEEQSSFDSTWVNIASYYSIWDNKSVNPYHIDPFKFVESIKIDLYDSAIGRNWSIPLGKICCRLNDDFGARRARWHYGVDLKLNTGDSIFSVFDGIIRIVKYDYAGYGNYVVVRHYNGFETVYGHMTKQLVEVGQIVRAGELIGWGGSTGRSSGPHLHFEIRYQGTPFDPQLMFDFGRQVLISKDFSLEPEFFSYLKRSRKVYYHTIRSGDTMYSISTRYNITIRQLCKMNSLTTRSTLRSGKRLRIK